jgi:thiosulfate/3-mercaptopyruvate sulfurtransferase
MQSINTQEVYNKLNDTETKIIDIRSVNAYNGWKEKDEARGGHIKGAKSLPAKWADYIDWIEIVRSKNITPKYHLILYGYDQQETEKIARLFIKAGFPNVSVYHQFIKEWSGNNNMPMEKLARYKHLVSAAWLRKLIATGKAPEYKNNKFIVCHAHYQNKDDYSLGHIPGAIDIDTNSLESTETWNRREPEELKKIFAEKGITHDTTVILYGRFSHPDNNDPFPGSSAGHLGAIRCAFIMMYAGVKDVRVLNGGLRAWTDEGYELSSEQIKSFPAKDFGTSIPAQPGLAVDIDEAQQMIKDKDKNLVSVRSWSEFIGEVSGYNYIEKTGRIPGAVFGDCGSDAYHMENYRNLDHTTREFHEIENMWKQAGITPDKHNAFYCGTGWRGSEAFLNAWLMGWPRVSVFDGGWFEWSNEGLPYETGIPSEKEQVIEQ